MYIYKSSRGILLLLFNAIKTRLIFESGGEEGTIGWSAAPTLVERQRENLTERLKREFGLFLSDDEEERARKHGTHRVKIYNLAYLKNMYASERENITWRNILRK